MDWAELVWFAVAALPLVALVKLDIYEVEWSVSRQEVWEMLKDSYRQNISPLGLAIWLSFVVLLLVSAWF